MASDIERARESMSFLSKAELSDEVVAHIQALLVLCRSEADAAGYARGFAECRERGVEAIVSLRHKAAANFAAEYSGAEGIARTDSFADAAKTIEALTPKEG